MPKSHPNQSKNNESNFSEESSSKKRKRPIPQTSQSPVQKDNDPIPVYLGQQQLAAEKL